MYWPPPVPRAIWPNYWSSCAGDIRERARRGAATLFIMTTAVAMKMNATKERAGNVNGGRAALENSTNATTTELPAVPPPKEEIAPREGVSIASMIRGKLPEGASEAPARPPRQSHCEVALLRNLCGSVEDMASGLEMDVWRDRGVAKDA